MEHEFDFDEVDEEEIEKRIQRLHQEVLDTEFGEDDDSFYVIRQDGNTLYNQE